MKKPFIISTFTVVSFSVSQCNAFMKSSPWNAHSCCKCCSKLFLPSKPGTSPSLVTAEQCLSFSALFRFSPLFVFLSAFVLLPGLSSSQLLLSTYIAAGWDGEAGNGCCSREKGEMDVMFVSSAQMSTWASNPWEGCGHPSQTTLLWRVQMQYSLHILKMIKSIANE